MSPAGGIPGGGGAAGPEGSEDEIDDVYSRSVPMGPSPLSPVPTSASSTRIPALQQAGAPAGPPGAQPMRKMKFTRDEIIEILKRHAAQHRADETFAQYIIDLATYLVEYRLHAAQEAERRALALNESNMGRRTSLAKTRDRDQELHDVLAKHVTRGAAEAVCKMCGAPTAGRVICLHCGNMAL